MIPVNFKRNNRRQLAELEFKNFQGVDVVDDNSNMPANLLPFAQNCDFGRQIGAIPKRLGRESIINDIVDLNAIAGVLYATVPANAFIGQTWTTGSGVTNLAKVILKTPVVSPSATGIEVKVYTDNTKSVLVGTASSVVVQSTNLYKVVFAQPITLSPATSYYLEAKRTTGQLTLSTTTAGGYVGQFYLNGVLKATTALCMETYEAQLGTGGIKGQHTYKRSSGDIPLIGHGTDCYKLSGTSGSIVKTTDEDFNAGTLVDVTVASNQIKLTATGGAYALDGTYTSEPIDLITAPTSATLAFNITTSGTVTKPSSAPTMSQGGGGGSVSGVFKGKVAFVDAMGAESELCDGNGSYSPAGVDYIAWSSIPVLAGHTRKLYRTNNGGEVYYLLATLNASDTTYVDYGAVLTVPVPAQPTLGLLLKTRGSSDNQNWGDWQAAVATGDGLPLARYLQIKAELSTSNNKYSPILTDYTITYNSGYGTATSIKAGLSGNRIHFADWDDRVWFCEGGRPQVWDGTTVGDVGVDIPATAPTLAASGSGSITGVYKAKVTLVNSEGVESNACALFGSVTAASNLQFDWTAIPTRTGCTRKLYRTKAGGSDYYYVATLNAADTTYTDTAADANLTVLMDTDNNVPPNSTIIHSHKNYMFYVDAAAPIRLYVSKVNAPDQIPSASFFQFDGPILGVKTLGDYLVVTGKQFKRYTGGSIFDVDPLIGDWEWKDLSEMGCISHDAMVECVDANANQMLIFPLETGVFSLSNNLLGSGLLSTPLSRNMQPYFDQAIDRASMSAIFCNQAYYVAINWANPAETASATNNAVFKLDLRNRQWSGIWTMPVAGFMVINNELYMTSSTDGRVYKYSGSDDDGAAIHMIADSSYIGDNVKRRFPKFIVKVKRGSVTTSTSMLTRVDNTERTIVLGANTNWAGAGGSARDVQDAVISPYKSIAGGRGYNVAWRIEDNTTNDITVYGVTVFAEPPS